MSNLNDGNTRPYRTDPAEKVSPLRALLRSRKALVFGLLLILIFVAAFGFIVVILRAAWRGEMTVKDAMGQVRDTVIAGIVGAVGATWKLMETIKEEDVARVEAAARIEAAPKVPLVNVASGENATATATAAPSVRPPSL